LAMRRRDHGPRRRVNVLSAYLLWPVFSCPSMAGFGCPPRVRLRQQRPGQLQRPAWAVSGGRALLTSESWLSSCLQRHNRSERNAELLPWRANSSRTFERRIEFRAWWFGKRKHDREEAWEQLWKLLESRVRAGRAWSKHRTVGSDRDDNWSVHSEDRRLGP